MTPRRVKTQSNKKIFKISSKIIEFIELNLKRGNNNQIIPSGDDYKIGELIDSAIITQTNEENGYFKVRLPRGKKQIGIIYKNQLSDIDSLNDILFLYYQRRNKIENLMITQHAADGSLPIPAKSKRCHYLTLKKSLIDYYTHLAAHADSFIPKSFNDLKLASSKLNNEHNVRCGCISKALPSGVLVELPFNPTNGYCSSKQIHYFNEMKPILKTGQSVLIQVNKLVSEKEQFLAQIRTIHDMVQSNPDDNRFMISLFKSYLEGVKKLSDESNENEKSPWSVGSNHSVKIGSVVSVVVRQFNTTTGQLDCVFLDELIEKNEIVDNCKLTATAFVDNHEEDEGDLDSDSNEMKNNMMSCIFAPGSKVEALVLGFDPIANSFCLTINKKNMKIYQKNFDTKFISNLKCKREQLIKGDILYVSSWFCIVGLKAHALGRLAFMPLFKNDFTQLDSANVVPTTTTTANNQIDIISKIKKKQLATVSTAVLSNSNEMNFKKDDKKFAYYCVGQIGKVIVKYEDTSNDLNCLIVVQDKESIKMNTKTTLRTLASLNEKHEHFTSNNNKRKDIEDDEPVLVTKKLKLLKKQTPAPEVTSKKNNKKRQNEEVKDSIEIVTNVKSNILKKPKLTTETTSTSAENATAFPWQVTDFDKFNKVINEDETNRDGSSDSSSSTDDNDNDSDNGKENQKRSKLNESKERRKMAKVLIDRNPIMDNLTNIDTTIVPTTADEFDKLLILQPNNSSLWIKYINYYLQLAEVDKARNVAQQALKTIIYREENERLNVWVALLQLENVHGTQAVVEDVFNRATQNCDSYKVHCHLADIYSNSSKNQVSKFYFFFFDSSKFNFNILFLN
jgi:hypothetical protein